MRKNKIFACMLLVCMLTLCACGSSSYDADSSTVYILKKGKVVTTDVEDFDEDTYSLSELEEYVKDAIDAYTSENGSKSVTLRSLSAADGVASLTIQYASVEDYAAFTGIELYIGTVMEALKAGYDFDVSFRKASDGEDISVSEVLDSTDLKIVIIQANTTVQVPGEIIYYSYDSGAYPEADDILVIGQGDASDMDSSTETETAALTEGTEAVTDTETESVETSGSISNDEMLTGETEDTEVTFDFDSYEAENEEEADSSVSLYTDIYTYIIYK